MAVSMAVGMAVSMAVSAGTEMGVGIQAGAFFTPCIHYKNISCCCISMTPNGTWTEGGGCLR